MEKKKSSQEIFGLSDIHPILQLLFGHEMLMEKKQSEIVMDSIVQPLFGVALWTLHSNEKQVYDGKSQVVYILIIS